MWTDFTVYISKCKWPCQRAVFHIRFWMKKLIMIRHLVTEIFSWTHYKSTPIHQPCLRLNLSCFCSGIKCTDENIVFFSYIRLIILYNRIFGEKNTLLVHSSPEQMHDIVLDQSSGFERFCNVWRSAHGINDRVIVWLEVFTNIVDTMILGDNKSFKKMGKNCMCFCAPLFPNFTFSLCCPLCVLH